MSSATEKPRAAAAALDISKANDLLANVDNRLSGGLHGAFFETGSRLETNTRHGQLEALFELKTQLSEVQAGLAKQAQRTEAENDRQSRGPGKPSAHMISTIKTIVEQQMSDKLRDLSIENERLKETVKKSNDMCAALGREVQVLEIKVKKLEQQGKTEKVTEAKFKAVQDEMSRMSQTYATRGEFGSLRREILSMCTAYTTEKKHKELDGKVDGVNETVKRLLANLVERVRSIDAQVQAIPGATDQQIQYLEKKQVADAKEMTLWIE